MKSKMTPQLARLILKWGGIALGVGTVIEQLWERGQLTWPTAIAALSAYFLGKSQEAPGGVAIYKLPPDVQESIRPTQPIPESAVGKGE